LDLTGRKWWEAGEECIMRSFINLCTLPNIIRMIKSRRMKLVGHAAYMGDMRYAYKILVGRLERKRSLRRPRH
jgi:hypothetical protein